MSAFNTYHYIALGCTAVALFIVVQYFGALLDFIRSLYRRRASKKHAVQRLRNLPPGTPLDAVLPLSLEIPIPVSGEVPPTLEQAEPLEVQPTATVPDPTTAEAQSPLEPAEPAAAPADVPLPLSSKVLPILEAAKPLEVEPAETAGVWAAVSVEVRFNLEPTKPPEIEPAASAEV